MLERLKSLGQQPVRWQYGLRTMLIIVALVAVLFGYRASQVAQRRRVVDSIYARGGAVLFRDEAPGRGGLKNLVRDFLGQREPVIVHLRGKTITDEVLASDVLPLTTLVRVDISNASVTNEGLSQLRPLESLVEVYCLRDERNARAFGLLNGTYHVDLENVPLATFLRRLSLAQQLSIKVDNEQVPADKVAATLLTVKLPRQRLGELLDQVLEPHELGWVLDGGKLVITTKSQGDKRRQVVAAVQAALPQVTQLTID